jgi:hypothetical protein
VSKQKTLFLEQPEEIPDFVPGEDLFTLEDDPAPPSGIDHTVLDVQLAIRDRDHLQFCTEDRLICGIPVKLGPDGPYYAIHLVKVFQWIDGEWRTADDRVIVGPLGGKQQ